MPKLPTSDSDSGVASLPSKLDVPATFRSSSSTVAVSPAAAMGRSSSMVIWTVLDAVSLSPSATTKARSIVMSSSVPGVA